jgi:peptide-methionine (S)-S-oxide reductase
VTDTDRRDRWTDLDRDAGVTRPGETGTAVFGMGCFWGPDARFGAMEGVVRTRVGYAGGTSRDPSYYALGDHTEVVRVEYDAAVLDYEDLLDVFWSNHNPTSSSGKRQYRAVVLAVDDTQREAARRTRETVRDRLGTPVTTDVEDLGRFYTAEEYHQKYELRSTPVLGDELVDRYGAGLVESTVAARLNGFVAGHGGPEHRDTLLATLDLRPALLDEIRRRV